MTGRMLCAHDEPAETCEQCAAPEHVGWCPLCGPVHRTYGGRKTKCWDCGSPCTGPGADAALAVLRECVELRRLAAELEKERDEARTQLRASQSIQRVECCETCEDAERDASRMERERDEAREMIERVRAEGREEVRECMLGKARMRRERDEAREKWAGPGKACAEGSGGPTTWCKGGQMLIVIEGIDGSGKTTLADGVARELKANRVEFPDYSTDTGAQIKRALAGETRLGSVMLQALMTVNKLEHIGELQDAAEGRSTLVLTRYWQSAVVYGMQDGLNPHWLARIHSTLPHGTINILVDCEPEEAIRRQVARGKPLERYEGKIETMCNVRDAYLSLWRMYEGPRWPVISSDGGPAVTLERAMGALRPYAAERRFQ